VLGQGTKRGLGIGEPVISRATQEWTLALAWPVFSPQKKILAIVSASTRLESLHTLLDPGDLSPGTIIQVIDHQGVVLARSIDSQKWIGQKLAELTTVKEMMRIRNGVDEYADSDGVVRVYAFSSTSLAPWLVMVGIPRDAAFAKAKSRVHRSLLLGACAFGVTLFLAWFLGGFISRPIRELTQDTRRFSEGHLDHRTSVSCAGEVGVLAHTFNDLATTLQEREMSLELAVRVRDDFLAIAAHELRTPLTPITIQTGMTLRKLSELTPETFPGIGDFVRMAEISNHQVKRLIRLVGDLLDVGRISGGKFTLIRELTDLSKIVREVVERYKPELDGTGTVCEVEADTPLVGEWDPVR